MSTTQRPPRAEGQWAVDGRTPLNPNEEFKAADDGLRVRERIETIYSREGFDSIPADDLHGTAALVGPVHPAQAGHRRRPHRRPWARTN